MFTDKTDFLVNTLEYYTEDTNRRCTAEKGRCYYSPKRADKASISEGCAIGRWMTPENQLKADTTDEHDSSIRNIIDEDIFPEWMRQLGIGFLSQCQDLHDVGYYWNKEGLTLEGKYAVEIMIKDFNLDKDKLNRFL